MRHYILSSLFLALASTAFGQQGPPSPNENFVRVEQIRKTGVTTEAQINALPIGRDKAVAYTYYDGLGRTIQTNNVKGSPGAKDVLQLHAYDVYGRVAKSYLPYTITTTNNGELRTNGIVEQGGFYTAANDKIADDSRPFYETSYQSTVAETYAPGVAWNQHNRKRTKKLSVNTASSTRLWFIDSSTGLPKSTTTYPAGALTIEEVTNEENRVARVYRDFTGKTVLKQEQNGASWLDTWYVYDDYDNLRHIIPPMASTTYTPTLANADLWFYQYEYDAEQRQIGYKAPGAGWIYTIYDKWDRPVLTQDANQRAKSPAEWSFVKYDDWNRPVMSGTMTSTATRATLTSDVAASGNRYETRNTTGVGYSLNQTYPANATETNLVSITYYDNYSYLSNTGWDAENYTYAFTTESGFTGAVFTNVKGLSTGSKVRVIGETRWLNSVTWYDNRYRPIYSITEHLKGGVLREHVQYDEYNQVDKKLLVNTAGNVRVLESYAYDNQGRLLKTNHKISDNTITNSPTVTLAEYQYNELGQVVDKKLHSTNGGSSYLQSLDYRYNIRGWLQSINNASLTSGTNNDDTNDYFGMELSYQEAFPDLPATAKFNGSISASKWNTGSKQQGYQYQYDAVERLQHAYYFEKGTTWSQTNKFSEYNISYNNNGNITALSRKSNGADMDILGYSYNGNQLTTVNDTGDKTAGFKDGYTAGTDYVYDANGNLKTDRNNKISDISYNVLNKPSTITFENGNKIHFRYDASGSKLWMEYRLGTAQTLAWRYDYVGPFVYKDNTLQTIAHEQGRIIKHASSFEYQYHVMDHLGNIRLTFTSAPQTSGLNATASSDEAQVEESQFMKLSETRALVHPSVNHTEGGSPEVVRLNGGKGVKDGPATMVKVMPGDTVRMKVYAKYLDLRKYNANAAATAVLAMLASPGATVSLGEGVVAEGVSKGALGGAASGLLGPESKSAPKAYLNYLLFDRHMQQVGRGTVQVSEQAAITEQSIAAPHEELALEVVAPQEGYLFSYLSHEENSNVDVYFDDFALTLAGGPIVQVDDFYPYGMTFNHEAGTNAVLNRYLYQGKEKISDDTDWYDFHARLYSPALGRFLSVDPQGQFANPYNGMGNNPVIGVDPDGEWVHLAVGALIGGTANLIANWGKVDNFWKGLGYFGVGAAAGALGAGVGAGISSTIAGGSFGAGFVGSQAAMTATSSFFSGAAIGSSSGFAGGFSTGFGNGLLGGQSFNDALWSGTKTGLIGAGTGGVIGGISGGIDAALDGRHFWSGQEQQMLKEYTLNVPTVKQVGEYDCAFGCLESIERLNGGSRTQTDFSNLMGNPKQGANTMEAINKAGFKATATRGGSPVSVGQQMSMGNPTIVAETTAQGSLRHAVIPSRIQIWQRGTGSASKTFFRTWVMNPANGRVVTRHGSSFWRNPMFTVFLKP